MHRIRFGMSEPNHDVKLNGTVEMDETYVGGKPRYKGVSKRGRGTNKTPVLGMVSRNGEIRTRVITRVTSKNLKEALNESVEPPSNLKYETGSALFLHNNAKKTKNDIPIKN